MHCDCLRGVKHDDERRTQNYLRELMVCRLLEIVLPIGDSFGTWNLSVGKSETGMFYNVIFAFKVDGLT